MKVILSNKDKSLGLVVPESDVTEIGLFSVDLLLRQIESLQVFRSFSDESISVCDVVRIAFANDGKGRAIILMKAKDHEGEGWIALCNRTEV